MLQECDEEQTARQPSSFFFFLLSRWLQGCFNAWEQWQELQWSPEIDYFDLTLPEVHCCLNDLLWAKKKKKNMPANCRPAVFPLFDAGKLSQMLNVTIKLCKAPSPLSLLHYGQCYEYSITK